MAAENPILLESTGLDCGDGKLADDITVFCFHKMHFSGCLLHQISWTGGVVTVVHHVYAEEEVCVLRSSLRLVRFINGRSTEIRRAWSGDA